MLPSSYSIIRQFMYWGLLMGQLMRCPVMTCLYSTLLSHRHTSGRWFQASCRIFSSPIPPIGAHQLGQISSGAAWQWCHPFNIASLQLRLALFFILLSFIWSESLASSRGYPLPFCGILVLCLARLSVCRWWVNRLGQDTPCPRHRQGSVRPSWHCQA